MEIKRKDEEERRGIVLGVTAEEDAWRDEEDEEKVGRLGGTIKKRMGRGNARNVNG